MRAGGMLTPLGTRNPRNDLIKTQPWGFILHRCVSQIHPGSVVSGLHPVSGLHLGRNLHRSVHSRDVFTHPGVFLRHQERLEALPFTRYTVVCQERIERQQMGGRGARQVRPLFGLDDAGESSGDSSDEEEGESLDSGRD